MALITHANICNTDNEIYCCLRNKIVKLDAYQKQQFCSACKMYAGDVDGRGVACVWEDLRDVSNPHYAADPNAEFASNQVRQVPPEGPALFLYSS
ncbi:hypothetical protein [Paenibacillus hexagrammi]|uniref:Uncharacterized protein n=1 Tax=Paenibacillus hexagrammi TaxID=2908839 RepID=A0ABY3SI06_9BACL|nr:hypothetical protein [Paenibacillus sp. YPD9-1]UJF32592.1 hypothetical protein L0M14_23560 [Paenibacillus sp. YPD9-1]